MARTVKTSEILQDDNLDALIAKLKQLEGVVENLTTAVKKEETAAAELESTTKTLTATTANGREQILKNVKASEDVERAHKAYTKALSVETAKVQELRIATATITNLKKNEAKAALSAEGSYNKLSAQYSIMKLALNAMSKAERESTEEGRQLVKTANATYQEMKRLQAETGKTALNVGNYSEAVQDAVQNVGEMRKELMALRNTSFAGKTDEEIATINKRIGDLVDGMADLKAEQAALGTEMSTLFVGSLKFVAAGVEAVIGSLTLLGVENESIKELEKKLVGLIAVTQALSEIEDVLQKRTLQTTAIRIQASLVNARDTVIKWANTVATTAQARAEEAKAVATARGNLIVRAAAAVQWAWNAALAANPFGLIVAGVLALTAGIVLLIRSQRESNEELRKAAEFRRINNELSQQAAINAVEEKIQVGNLINILKDENSTKAEKAKALKLLNEIAPEYFKGLTIEKDGVEAIAKAYTEKYLPALAKRAKFEAANQRLVEIEKKLLDTQTRLAETKPGFFDVSVAIIQNFGDKVGAAKDLTKEWTQEIEENKRGLETEREAVLKFIQTNDLATQALNSSTEATKENTKAKKEKYSLEEKLAIAAANELKYLRELEELLKKDFDLPMLQELSGGGQLAPDKLYSIGRNIGAALGEGLGDAKPLQSIFDINAEKDIKARAAKIGASVGDGLKSGIGESLNVFDRLAQGESIYDLMGIDISDKGKEQVKSSFDFAKGQLSEFMAFRTEIANRNVQNADREVQAAQAALDNQITLAAAGLANTVETRQKDLEDAKQRQAEALKQQERTAKAERAIQTIQQATNLITGISKLFAEKNILAIPLAALMLGSFIGFKLAAVGAAKKEYAEGDYQVLKGGSHASGNDVPLGTHSSDGRPEYAEGGEARMILSKRSTRKYKSVLPQIFHALKKGTFEMEFTRQANAARDLPLIMNVGQSSHVSMGGVENRLGKLIEQGRNVTLTDSKGRPKTVVRGNLTTVYKYSD